MMNNNIINEVEQKEIEIMRERKEELDLIMDEFDKFSFNSFKFDSFMNGLKEELEY